MKTESESQSTLNTETMCRLCLCQSGDENSVEIFFTNDLSLTVRIMACAGLEVCWLFIILDDQHDLNVKKKNSNNFNINLGDTTRPTTQADMPRMSFNTGEIILISEQMQELRFKVATSYSFD